ncbi:MAG: alpha-amylase family glycosyl hydrolase [Geminicoccaceae bacterium]
MTSDLLARKVTSFVLWLPGGSATAPQLVIGTFTPGNPLILGDERRLALRPVAEVTGLWELPAAECGLAEGTIHHYWFEVADTVPWGAAGQRVLCTDPTATAVDWRLLAPPLPPPYGEDDRQPAGVVRFAGGRLVGCDPAGPVDTTVADVRPDRLPTNRQIVIYELPTAWSNGDERGVGTFRDVLALIEEDVGGANFAGLDVQRRGRSYLGELGVNALELLPPADSFYRREWGYGTTNFLAPDFELGFPEGNSSPSANADFLALSRACHRRGIRVIVDKVMAFAKENAYEHADFASFHNADPGSDQDDPDALTSTRGFGHKEVRNGFGSTLFRYARRVTAYDPLTGEDAAVAPARQLMQIALERWMRDFAVDGVRMDSVENVANWDFIEAYRRRGHTLFQERWTAAGLDVDGADRFLVVGEELSMPMDLLAQGRLDGLWNDRFRAGIRAALLGEGDAGDGFEWTLRKAIDCRLVGFASGTQAVNYLTSHDVEGYRRERLFNFLQANRVPEIEKRIKLAFACLLTAVGIPMILAGDEFADQHDLFDADGHVTQGGGKQVDPVNFARQQEPMRQQIFRYVARLVKLRTDNAALATDDTDFIHVDLTPGRRVLAWVRGPRGGEPVVTVANFSDFGTDRPDDPRAEYVVPNWPAASPDRPWREITQDRVVPPEWVGREPLFPWEAKVYVPS